MAAEATTLLALLGYLCRPDVCPITANKGVPICNDYLNRNFDYIIIGAGVAGCVLANRLTEDSRINVLLIEAGDYPSRASEIPLNFMNLYGTKEDWAFKLTDPALFKGYTNHTVTMAQGRALGGGSTINGMIQKEGVPQDYLVWSQLVDESWSWENVQPYFDKVLQTSPVSNYVSTRAARGFLNLAADQLGISVNDPQSSFGYRDAPVNIVGKTRNSKVKAYLRPIATRSNLCVVINRTVSKILMLNETTACGIEVQEPFGVVTVTARREIIVTAGAINSPKLLMLSGIGPRKHLTDLGVPKIYQALPVGQNLEDHVHLTVFATLPDFTPAPDFNVLLCAYCTSGLFLDTIDLTNFIGFFNTHNDTTQPNVEFLHVEVPWGAHSSIDGFVKVSGFDQMYADQLQKEISKASLLFFLPILLHPKSRGQVLLRSLDSTDPPIIEPNYLAFEEDVQVLVDAVQKFVKPILTTAPFRFSRLITFDIPECDAYSKDSIDYWRCYVRTFANGSSHPAGTCRMGKDRHCSVVNAELKVWGVDNLRVADSSTIPYLISGHLTAPTAMIAEKAADLIKVDPRYHL